MTDARNKITQLTSTGESEKLEFKKTTGAKREAAKTVCAMLNKNGGQLLFGVADNGQVLGQQVSASTIEKISAEIQQIEPKAYPLIERIQISEKTEVIMVQINHSQLAPYRYRGVPYIRVGNTTQIMSNDEYTRMLFERMHSEQRWENQPAEGWTVDDLDFTEIRNTVAEAVRIGRLNEPERGDAKDLLRGLGLFRDGVLFRAAAVLFGKKERLEFEMPQCLLRIARFKGLDRSEFLDNRQFIGNAFSLLSRAVTFLNDTFPIASRFESGKLERIDEPLYPPLATREALANAFCHRDYSIGGSSVGLAVYDDRLEVTSTGILHFGQTPEDLFLPHESRPWNPLIARTFYMRGIIEEWGRGTIELANLAVAAGLPHPEIEEHGNCVTVRFRRYSSEIAQGHKQGLTNQQIKILQLLKFKGALPLREIHATLGLKLNKRGLREDLKILKIKGLVESSGTGRGSRWQPL
ncbi:MAG: putative DNA binding domain-containing protein [Rhodobacteraceae bacterium]|nr:putative DNA binding domain-containing protein [Paracoccaceae bacterium]